MNKQNQNLQLLINIHRFLSQFEPVQIIRLEKLKKSIIKKRETSLDHVKIFFNLYEIYAAK